MPKKKENSKTAVKKIKQKKELENKKEKVIKEEVCEIFDVEKDGKEKVVKSCGIETEKPATNVQIKKEYKAFKIIIILMLGLILLFLGIVWLVNYFNHFSVGRVAFEVDRTTMAGKTLYRTSLPVQGESEITGKTITGEYNFWLRNDPRELKENVDFYGVIRLKKENVIRIEDDFKCDGYGVIAVANLLKLYEVIGGNVIKDENASCDIAGRFGFIKIMSSDKNYIDKVGPACYTLYVKDCDILKVTERYMLEVLDETTKNVRL